MKFAQRIVLVIGALGVFHSSLVPPVSQRGAELCRYHEFTERVGPFARLFDAAGVDGVALMTEYGIILSLTAMAYLAIGLLGGKSQDED